MSEPAVRSVAQEAASRPETGVGSALAVHLLIGVLFGFVATRGEIISWYRIQEMFRFQGFHMYGVLFSAMLVAGVGLQLIRRTRVRTLGGGTITIDPKDMGRGYRVSIGGVLFGLGWGLTGACPGPIFALIGSGYGVMVAVLLAALVGTWVYGNVRERLPH